MSLLQILRESLEANPRVIIADVRATDILPKRMNGRWSHKHEFLIAPQPAFFSADALNGFLNCVVDQKLISKPPQPFRQTPDGLYCGRLYFREKLLELRTTTEVNFQAEDLDAAPWSKLLKEKTTEYYRTMVIRAYPCLELAQQAGPDRRDMDFIAQRELQRYQA